MESKPSHNGKVILSGTVNKEYTWEHISPQHIVAFIYSGEMIVSYGRETLSLVAGDTVLVPKNKLTRVVKYPADGKPFKVVSMLIPEVELRKFYLNRSVLENWDDGIAKQRPVKSSPLLESFFGSLLSYFDIQDELPNSLVSIKIQEVLTIIDEVDKRASSILGSFSEIGKIDLQKYMEEHFMYNLPLEKFAFLTGRSLTTFKSDFKKIFGETPGKWLMQKRLDLAHYKITKEKQKATAVYLSAGFENLSHFSFAFKKAFGFNPSTINKIKLTIILTTNNMEILKTATDWAKAEVFSSRFFIFFGILFIVATIGFWQLGKTDTAKAYIIPALVAGSLLLAIGFGIFFTNKSRITSFESAYHNDPSAFIKSEITRTEKSMSEYKNIVFKVIPFIIVAAALLIFFVNKPTWQATGIITIAMMVVILLVDSNANARITEYHEQLLQAINPK